MQGIATASMYTRVERLQSLIHFNRAEYLPHKPVTSVEADGPSGNEEDHGGHLRALL